MFSTSSYTLLYIFNKSIFLLTNAVTPLVHQHAEFTHTLALSQAFPSHTGNLQEYTGNMKCVQVKQRPRVVCRCAAGADLRIEIVTEQR